MHAEGRRQQHIEVAIGANPRERLFPRGQRKTAHGHRSSALQVRLRPFFSRLFSATRNGREGFAFTLSVGRKEWYEPKTGDGPPEKQGRAGNVHIPQRTPRDPSLDSRLGGDASFTWNSVRVIRKLQVSRTRLLGKVQGTTRLHQTKMLLMMHATPKRTRKHNVYKPFPSHPSPHRHTQGLTNSPSTSFYHSVYESPSVSLHGMVGSWHPAGGG